MNLGFIDPPLEDFEFNGTTYKYELFENEHRNGYSKKYANEWTAGATVIHEFCHVLGMDHEHQNNLNNSNIINFNVANILKSYGSYEEAKTNVLDLYSDKRKFMGSNFDKDSIMLYYFDDDWVIGENPTKPNHVLSATDILWLKNIYPKYLDTKPQSQPQPQLRLQLELKPQMNIYFIDTDKELAPDWKKAWVMKTVCTQLFPHIGIKACFFNASNELLYKYEYNVETEAESESESEAELESEDNTETKTDDFFSL